MHAWVILALALVGCGAGDTVYVDKAFTPDETADIRSAFQEWQDRALALADVVYGADVSSGQTGKRMVLRVTGIAGACVDRPACVWTSRYPIGHAVETERVLLWPEGMAAYDEKPDAFRRVLLHELGHHFGIDTHDTGEHTVMHDLAEHITPADVAAYQMAQ